MAKVKKDYIKINMVRDHERYLWQTYHNLKKYSSKTGTGVASVDKQIIALCGDWRLPESVPEPSYEVSIKRIPFETDEGKIAFMKLRQLFVYSKPISNSGNLRITYKKEMYSVIDQVSGKRVDTLDGEGLILLLRWIFEDADIINTIFQELHE